jgi:hypothetical protein
MPNAGAHLLTEAGARHERTLEAVRCSALLGGNAVYSFSKGQPECDGTGNDAPAQRGASRIELATRFDAYVGASVAAIG